MGNGWFFVCKPHFEWLDQEKGLITCEIRSHEGEFFFKADLNMDSRFICLTEGSLDFERPKPMTDGNVRDFVYRSVSRWIEKQKEMNSGFKTVTINDPEMGIDFPMTIMYPTEAEESELSIGPYELTVAKDAPLLPGTHPLVLLSHGTGSTPLAYWTVARFLARHRFIVGSMEHPFNNRKDDSKAGTLENLLNRPRHLSLALDYFMNESCFSVTDQVSVIGHSLGAYTALAAAGGVGTTFPRETGGTTETFSVKHDERIKSLVLMAPAAGWFRESGSLDKVDLRILLLTGEKDEITPEFHAEIIKKSVRDPEKIEHHVIDNAGHFSFLSPFPESRVTPSFPPSQDPDGFDRKDFHQRLNKTILAFLQGF